MMFKENDQNKDADVNVLATISFSPITYIMEVVGSLIMNHVVSWEF